MESSTCSAVLPPTSCFRLLQLWPFLLLATAVPSHSAWSLRSRGALTARPLCRHRGPPASKSVCIWDASLPSEKGSHSTSQRPRPFFPKGAAGLRSVVRLKRQAQGGRPATPSGFEDGLSSSQYPWAIVWGPTISVEDGGDANSANPGFPPVDYTFVSSSGVATPQPDSHSHLHNEGLNLRQPPATLRPFLFGPRGEGVDPQLYVTITISAIIVLVAMGIILKFCWDRNQKRRHHSSQQTGLQQGSQQPLTDLSPAAVSILGPYSDSPVPVPEMAETGPALEGMEKLEELGKTSAFQLNRIPLVNL